MNNNAKAAIVFGVILFFEDIVLRIWNPETIMTMPVYTSPPYIVILVVCISTISCYAFLKSGEVFSGNNNKVQSCL